jgi:hypothetical protein
MYTRLAGLQGITEIDGLIAETASNKKAYNSAAVLCCEGILHYALSHKVRKTAEVLARQQLQLIAGEFVCEAKIQPCLLAEAKKLIG